MNRELCGMYFRIKRNNKWQNICFSDMTESEMHEILKDKGDVFLRSMCIQLSNSIKDLGNTFDIVRKGE